MASPQTGFCVTGPRAACLALANNVQKKTPLDYAHSHPFTYLYNHRYFRN